MQPDTNFSLEYNSEEKESTIEKSYAESTWFSVNGDLDDFIFYGETIVDKSER